MDKILEINFIFIENSFIYKHKDILKYKNSKNVVNYLDVTSKLSSKNILNQKFLIGSIVLKRLMKCLTTSIKEKNYVYYVISKIDPNTFKNIFLNINNKFDGEIIYNVYTDSKISIKEDKIQNWFTLEKLLVKDEC